MPIYVDVISRLDEKSAASAASRIDKQFTAVGAQTGKSTGEAITAEIDKATRTAGSNLTTEFGKQGAPAGKNFGKSFGTGAKSSIADVAKEINAGLVSGMSKGGAEGAKSLASGLKGGAGLAEGAGAAVGAAAGAGLVLAFAAALKGLYNAIDEGMAQLRTRDLFQAKLGLDTPSMEKIGSAAGEAYARGVGESIEANMKTISAGISSGLINSKASQGDIANFTERMTTTSNITGEDPTEIATKSRNIVRSGLAKDYTEVLDLLNSDSGKQLDISGDLLDTTEEYATAWHGVGISAADAFGLMKQMSDAGIRNTDVAADSLKELSINVVDDSKTTRAALQALGFDADDMNRRFAQGGPVAREAFGAVLTAMQDLQNPVDKNNVGLALFKTKWEDAKTAIEAANLKNAANDMGQIDGATDKATKQINTHADAWGNLGRTIEETWDKVEKYLADSWLGKFVGHSVPDWLNPLVHIVSSDNLPKDTPHYPPGYHPPTARDLLGANAIPGGPPNPTVDTFLPGARPGGPVAPDLKKLLGGSAPNPALDSLFPTALPPGFKPPPPGLQHGAQGPMVTEGGAPKLPDAPVLPFDSSLPAYMAGVPQTQSIYSAETSFLDARHGLAEKRARADQLDKDANATESDKLKARNEVVTAERSLQSAEMQMMEARKSLFDKGNKQLKGQLSAMEGLGAQLDSDFGISKGLGGIVENAVKALGNALAAPFLQALGMISKANPNEGSGIVGIAAANGAFGAQYTPGAIAAAQRGGVLAYPGVGMAGYGGAGAYPGDAALLANIHPGSYSQDAGRDLLKGLSDCSSSVGDLVTILDTGRTSGDKLTTGNAASWLPQHGFVPGVGGPGDFRVGYNGGHMQATLPGGTPWNWGSDAAAARGGVGGSGADDPSLTSHYYRPSSGWPSQLPTPLAPAPTSFSSPDLYSPANTDPGLSAPLPVSFAGGGGRGPGGMPQGLPIGPAGGQPPVGLGTAYPSQGGNSGNILGGMAMDGIMAATSGIDMMAPGASAAAKIGIQVANRTIGYGAQNLGILASGLMETLSVGDNPKGSLGAGWIGKLAGGFAGAAPALPNLAGGQKQPLPADAQGQAAGTVVNQNDQSVHVTNNGATENQNGKTIAEHQAAMYAPAGKQ